MNLALLLLVALLMQVATRPPEQPPIETTMPADAEWVELEPDVATRGTVTTIVVIGARIQAAKTLQVSPPDGVTVDAVRVLLPRNGKPAAAVTLTVAPDAEPGDRALLLTVAPEITMSLGARPGDEQLAQQLETMREAIRQRETKPTELGTIHINSHAITVTDVQVLTRGRDQQLRIDVADAQGDVETTSPVSALTLSGSDAGLAAFSPTITAEMMCKEELISLDVDEPSIQNRQAASLVLLATVFDDSFPAAPGCDLRVRVQDRDGNTSPWFTRSRK